EVQQDVAYPSLIPNICLKDRESQRLIQRKYESQYVQHALKWFSALDTRSHSSPVSTLWRHFVDKTI
ncbi:MAG: hypothetical protein ACK5LJ_02080, partial [Paracoccus sp. (in: a-proteobacteria)]